MTASTALFLPLLLTLSLLSASVRAMLEEEETTETSFPECKAGWVEVDGHCYRITAKKIGPGVMVTEWTRKLQFVKRGN